MSYSAKRAAQQMQQDGIRKLRTWTKPVQIGCAGYQFRIDRPRCGHADCEKIAGYSTPNGNRCFSHARALGTPASEGEE